MRCDREAQRSEEDGTGVLGVFSSLLGDGKKLLQQEIMDNVVDSEMILAAVLSDYGGNCLDAGVTGAHREDGILKEPVYPLNPRKLGSFGHSR